MLTESGTIGGMGKRQSRRDRDQVPDLVDRYRSHGLVVLEGGRAVVWSMLAEQIVATRAELAEHQRLAVVAARAAGVSWDRISAAFGGVPTGEHLRRLYGASS